MVFQKDKVNYVFHCNDESELDIFTYISFYNEYRKL